MKILVLSDSHSGLRFMRRCMEIIKPQVMIHLGDYYDDGQAMAEEFPSVTVYQVPGNCDKYRAPLGAPEIMVQTVGGVRLYLTHGHRHHVKMTRFSLIHDAKKAGASAVLYGHTHVADCSREDDGLWVLNPGSCGYYGGSVGLMEVENKKIKTCRILRQEDLEDMV